MDLFSPCILSGMQLKKYLYLKIEEIERELEKDVKDIRERCKTKKLIYIIL